jgi:Protein of unknown function DUF262
VETWKTLRVPTFPHLYLQQRLESINPDTSGKHQPGHSQNPRCRNGTDERTALQRRPAATGGRQNILAPMEEEEQSELNDRFADEEGESAVAWQALPPERDFFATPFDPPIKTLVQEIVDGELVVRPTFQRNQVWDPRRKSKFVESLLLNIPIPTLFFAEDEDNTKVVVDGQQRLRAAKEFVENRYPLVGLEVLAALNGKRFEDLTDRQQRIIKNRTLRCLLISARSDSEIRFQVFERLNQGGMPLNAQEVRHCVYRGELNSLLHDLVKQQTWLKLLRRDKPHHRMTDCELILRFFAIRDALPDYRPPLKTLLNEYMRAHRHADDAERSALTSRFSAAVESVALVFPDIAFRRYSMGEEGPEYDVSVNRAVFDIQMIAMEGISPEWLSENKYIVREAFEKLCIDDPRFADTLNRATADKSRLGYRLHRWAHKLVELGAEVPAMVRVPEPAHEEEV